HGHRRFLRLELLDQLQSARALQSDIHQRQVGPVIEANLQAFPNVVRLRADAETGVAVDQRRQALAEHPVVLHEDDARFAFVVHTDSAVTRCGTRQVIFAPPDSWFAKTTVPPISRARCCMIVNPSPAPACGGTCGKPAPLSSTERIMAVSSTVRRMVTA